jgi:VIT1/CCC1 family predicted Fe2+/Mn2+ transporter
MFDHLNTSKRVLEPHDRISEVLFGLIMVLTFTGSLSVADAGRENVRTMLIGALGCNLAWGIVDGVLYLMGCLADKDRKLTMLKAVRKVTDLKKAQRLIAAALPAPVASILKPEEFDSIRERLNQLPEPPTHAHLGRNEWMGAFGVFLLVVLSMLPVAVPFMIIENARMAIRASNGVAVVMLFIAGFAYGRSIGRSPKLIGLGMVILGVGLVALTIALGG